MRPLLVLAKRSHRDWSNEKQVGIGPTTHAQCFLQNEPNRQLPPGIEFIDPRRSDGDAPDPIRNKPIHELELCARLGGSKMRCFVLAMTLRLQRGGG